MSIMKDIFISMQEAYISGADIEKQTAKRLADRSRQIALAKTNKQSNVDSEKSKEKER